MIHSMSGGVIRDKKYYNFAKVRLESGEVRWYVSNIVQLKVGDSVVVPFLHHDVKAVVLRVDRNVSEQVAPISVKHAGEIIKII